MRISCLLTLTLLSATAIAAQPRPTPQHAVPAAPAVTKSSSPSATEDSRVIVRTVPMDQLDQLDATTRERMRAPMRWAMTPTQVCYTMQNYRLSRDSPDSDLTRVTGHSTCLPSQEFQLKQAAPAQR